VSGTESRVTPDCNVIVEQLFTENCFILHTVTKNSMFNLVVIQFKFSM
jgi:hypothetical protein